MKHANDMVRPWRPAVALPSLLVVEMHVHHVIDQLVEREFRHIRADAADAENKLSTELLDASFVKHWCTSKDAACVGGTLRWHTSATCAIARLPP